MSKVEFSYPHPVLGNSDDIDSKEILPLLECSIYDEVISVKIRNLSTNHEEIDGIIKSGDAKWVIRVSCPRTYFRETFTTSDEQWSKKFEGYDMEGSVSVDISVIAIKNIESYKPSHMHSDYEDTKFNIGPGELLAIAPSYTFLVDKHFDSLKAPISSLIKVEEGEMADGPFKCSFDDDMIIVSLSKSDWEEYAAIRDRAASILHSSIVLPVLITALEKASSSRYDGLLWSDRLENIVNQNNLNIEDHLHCAQCILSNPLNRTFLEVNKYLDDRSQ